MMAGHTAKGRISSMRKMKKINGYLVVKFNDRELREYEGTALGKYGVIDAELYTGILDIDRGAMEYTTSFNPKTTILCGLKSRSGRGWAFKSGRSSCPRA